MEYFDQSDVQQNKTIVMVTAIIQLFFPIIFFLPLVACKGSAYGRFYANQGLILFVLCFIMGLIYKVSIIIGGIVALIVLIFGIINVVNAYKGARKGIPVFGGIEIIK